MTKHKQVEFLNQIFSYLAIGSLLFLAIGLKDIDNYIDWFLFSITLIVTGLLFGITLYVILSFFIPEAKSYKNTTGVGLLAPLAFAFSFIFFGMGSVINESSNHNKKCKEYIIQEMGESGSKQRAYFIFINNGNEIERLSFGKAFNKKHNVGDTINLCIITGRLGFKYYKINTGAFKKQQ